MLLDGQLCSGGASHGHEEQSERPIAAEMGRVHTVLPTFPYTSVWVEEHCTQEFTLFTNLCLWGLECVLGLIFSENCISFRGG